MLGQEDKGRLPAGGAARRAYLRSVSWTDRSPIRPNPGPQPSGKARPSLPPLQPLSINRRPVEEWPSAGSDDLGVWPNPQTPRAAVAPRLENSDLGQQPVREFQFKKDKLAFFDKECSRIADHIYLGSDAVAKNRDVLRQNGITHVLNCVGFVCPEYFKGDLVYKTLWLRDSPSEDITSILYDVFDYFEDVREHGGRVLVHCCQGVSRSTSLVIAYLMWREGQSFEDAFQYVKAARGVTNPNMGFACQLLQCQKRVHAVPVSPNSVLRMYRMAPHSSYDPLHLVPKLLSQPGVEGLDSRGAFLVHVPTAIFVWAGKHCSLVMSDQARVAANQVVRYERAQGAIVSVKEGEEPSEFWDALSTGQTLALAGGASKKVDQYDLDFELFHKALAGGVVPPLSMSNAESETCLPARENGWGRLRQKFANGMMKEFITSSKLNGHSVPSSFNDRIDMVMESLKESEPSSPRQAYPQSSPDSLECLPNSSPDWPSHARDKGEYSAILTGPVSPPSPCGSSDSFSCFPRSSNKSPTLSPSASDYSSNSFSFSPSSSNWSDLSYMTSQQPSPSGLETIDPLCNKNFCLFYREASSPPGSRSETTCLPCKGTSPSIAERRGTNPPPQMLLSTIHDPPKAARNLIRSWSFSLPDLDADIMMKDDVSGGMLEHDSSGEEEMLDADICGSGHGSVSEVNDREVCGVSNL